MFPKAHAAAYVMMAYRIAYCKVNYPLAYYAAYFSIRASAFSYELMCQGKEKLEFYLRDYKNRSDSLSKKDQDTLKDMRIVQEMYARGYEFLPLDIYRAKATKFQIIDGKSPASKEWAIRRRKQWKWQQKMDHIFREMILDSGQRLVKLSLTLWRILGCLAICRKRISCHCLICKRLNK